MKIDDKIEINNYNMTLTEKQQKYQPYHQVKFINMNILQVKKYYPSNQRRVIEQATFTSSPMGKAFRKTDKNN